MFIAVNNLGPNMVIFMNAVNADPSWTMISGPICPVSMGIVKAMNPSEVAILSTILRYWLELGESLTQISIDMAELTIKLTCIITVKNSIQIIVKPFSAALPRAGKLRGEPAVHSRRITVPTPTFCHNFRAVKR